MIEQIEEEFDQHQLKMEKKAREKALDKDSDYIKHKRQRIDQENKEKKDGEKEEGATSNDFWEVPNSLPHSKSLSNNRSRSSQQVEQKTDMQKTVAFPYQFIPIILICCPNVVKGEQCNCGHNNYYPANDFYSNQMS